MGREADKLASGRGRPGSTVCPYCHDDCQPEADVAVCRACLARHHRDCWREARTCSGCGAAEALEASASETAVPSASRSRQLLGWSGWALTLAGLLVLAASYTIWVEGHRALTGANDQPNPAYFDYQHRKAARDERALLLVALGLGLVGASRARSRS